MVLNTVISWQYSWSCQENGRKYCHIVLTLSPEFNNEILTSDIYNHVLDTLEIKVKLDMAAVNTSGAVWFYSKAW